MKLENTLLPSVITSTIAYLLTVFEEINFRWNCVVVRISNTLSSLSSYYAHHCPSNLLKSTVDL